jgi:hypothetical protein
MAFLEDQRRFLEGTLNQINKRLEELRKEQTSRIEKTGQ